MRPKIQSSGRPEGEFEMLGRFYLHLIYTHAADWTKNIVAEWEHAKMHA